MRLMRPLCHCLCEGCVDVSEATLRLLSPSYLATLQPAGPIKTTAEVRFKCRVRGRGVLQDGVYYKSCVAYSSLSIRNSNIHDVLRSVGMLDPDIHLGLEAAPSGFTHQG